MAKNKKKQGAKARGQEKIAKRSSHVHRTMLGEALHHKVDDLIRYYTDYDYRRKRRAERRAERSLRMAAISAETAEAAAMANSVAAMLKLIGVNHPEWYAKAGKYGFAPIGLNYATDFMSPVDTGNTYEYSPTFAAKLTVLLGTHSSHSSNSGDAAAAQRIMSMFAAAKGYRPDYSDADITAYAYDMRVLVAMIAIVGRALNLCSKGSITNTAIPDTLSRVYGFDIEDFTANQGVIIDYMRSVISQIRAIYPMFGTVLDRTMWMFSGAFLNQPESNKPMLTVVTPADMQLSRPGEYKIPNCRLFREYFSGATYAKWADTKAAISSVLAEIKRRWGGSDICTDALRVFGFDQTNKVCDALLGLYADPTGTGMLVFEDEYMMRQLQNAKPLALHIAAQGINVDSTKNGFMTWNDECACNIGVTATVIDATQALYFAGTLAQSLREDRSVIINGDKDELSTEMNVSMTAFTPVSTFYGQGPNVVQEATDYMSEVPIEFYAYRVRYQRDADGKYQPYSLQATTIGGTAIVFDDESQPNGREVFELSSEIATIAQVEYAPDISLTYLRVISEEEIANLETIRAWDYDAFTIIHPTQLESLHRYGSFSLWLPHEPMITRAPDSVVSNYS